MKSRKVIIAGLRATVIYMFAGLLAATAVAWGTAWEMGRSIFGSDWTYEQFRGYAYWKREKWAFVLADGSLQARIGSIYEQDPRSPYAATKSLTSMPWWWPDTFGEQLDGLIDERRAFSRAVYGWPVPCWAADCIVDEEYANPRIPFATEVVHGVGFEPRLGLEYAWPALPTVPLMRGLAIDGVVFGTVIAAVHMGYAAAKRWMKRKDGVCRRCGYQVNRLSRCPECGHAHASQ